MFVSSASPAHRVSPLLRAACLLAGAIAAFATLLFAWLTVAPDAASGAADRLLSAGLALGFACVTAIFATSAIRGRSPAAVPVRAPLRETLMSLAHVVGFIVAIAAIQPLKARFGAWVAYGIAGIIAGVAGFLTQNRPHAGAKSDSSSH
jgi:hypothetical protein